MYNKNPKEYRQERARRPGHNKKVGYGLEDNLADEMQGQDDQGQDEQPEIEQYSDEEYDEFSPEKQ